VRFLGDQVNDTLDLALLRGLMLDLQRLLAEQRLLVLNDEEGAAAFRDLLSAFAAAGNEAALTLAYTFGDVFR
jgi:hypothetical protein